MSPRLHILELLRSLTKTYVTHNRIEVSRAALLHNLDFFSAQAGLPAIPVLKGNAYGHGLRLVAKALKDRKLPYIAVDGYFEALRIREVSDQPVLVMGAILPENYARLKYDKFAFVVHDHATVEALGKTGKRLKVHLEINTGMNRYGVHPRELRDLVEHILGFRNLELEGVMSHLADSDGDDQSTVDAAVAQFDAAVELVRELGAQPSIIHVAQTAGSLKARSKYATAFRLGIGLYGLNPFPPGHQYYDKLRQQLRPALRLVSTITKIIPLQEGDKVSYSYTFSAPRDMTIGVLPLGYYEGVNRALSNAGSVSVDGQDAPIVGRVCMNHTMFSLEELSSESSSQQGSMATGPDGQKRPPQVGDEVVVYSNDPAARNSLDQISQEHGLFNYNLLTALSHDVRRILVP